MKSRKNGYKLFVDTMHASKGEEADIVIVIDFVNSRIKKEIARSKKSTGRRGTYPLCRNDTCSRGTLHYNEQFKE